MLSFHSSSLDVPAALRHELVAHLASAQIPPPPFTDWCVRTCSSHYQKDAPRTSDEASSNKSYPNNRLVNVKVKVQVVPRRTRRPTLPVLGLTNGIAERTV